MNNALFTSLITTITALDDTQGAQLLAIANGFASVGASAQPTAPAQAPEPAPKREYEPATDVALEITMVALGKDDKRKAFTLGYGAGRAGAKAYVKDAGFKWDATVNAYVGDAKAYKALGIKGNGNKRTLPVSAQWVQVGRDKAQAKAERKARKGA